MQSRAGQLLPLPGNAGPDAPQGTVGPSGSQGTLPLGFKIPLTRTLRFPFAGLLSSPSPPSLYIQPGLPNPRCRTQNMFFFMQMGTTLKFAQNLVHSLPTRESVLLPA